jgi:hypothetical protein
VRFRRKDIGLRSGISEERMDEVFVVADWND